MPVGCLQRYVIARRTATQQSRCIEFGFAWLASHRRRDGFAAIAMTAGSKRAWVQIQSGHDVARLAACPGFDDVDQLVGEELLRAEARPSEVRGDDQLGQVKIEQRITAGRWFL